MAGKAAVGLPHRAARRDLYLCAALAMVVVSTLYWSAFAANAYATFHEYEDLGSYASSLYFDINYPSVVHGLQFLVFGNHISPDALLLMPFFYIDGSALTLLFVQAAVVSLAGLVAFAAARRATGSGAAGLLLCAAFLLDPGTHGITVFDFHVEMLLPLFVLMTFYFYVRVMRVPFVLSAALLLGVIEEAPFLGISLGLGLLVYELLNADGTGARRARLGMAAGLILLSAAALLAYQLYAGAVTQMYSAGAYPNLPPDLRYASSLAGVFSGLGSAAGASQSSTLAQLGTSQGPYVYYALALALFGMGDAFAFAPLESLVLLSPWLAETSVVGNFEFVFIFNQYFSYARGGMAVAAILGMASMRGRRSVLARMLRRSFGAAYAKPVLAASLSVVLVLLLLSPAFVYSKNVNNLAQDFLFQVSPQQRALYSQLYSVMDMVPANAPLMTQYFVMPHVFARRYYERSALSEYYFTPQYVIIEDNLNVSLNAFSIDYGGMQAFLANNSARYVVVARNGTAELLERAA